jgi:hypothetical protein
MGTRYEMYPGTLKGMGRELDCLGNYSPESRPSVQGAPPDRPGGEYLFTFRHGTIAFRKNQRVWLEEI